MKHQYLGDARDAFKWEYQDFLCRRLGYEELQIVPMLTQDDGTTEGSTRSAMYPATSVIHDFCEKLRESRSLVDLKNLPLMTGAEYRVRLHKPETTFLDFAREEYFADLHSDSDQLVFIDPDIGFEPRGRLDKHVAYSDVESLLEEVTRDSTISVYQHKRRAEPFCETLNGIRQRLSRTDCTAIFNNSVMFITFSRSRSVIERVGEINTAYAADRSLDVIGAERDPNMSIDEILSALNEHKIRATYSAVASLVGTHPLALAGEYLGDRRPYASWVVSRSTRMPTKYALHDCHPDLEDNSHVIDDAAELFDLLRK